MPRTLDDLFRLLDGAGLPPEGFAIEADKTLAAIGDRMRRGPAARARALLDDAIAEARRARRAALLGMGELSGRRAFDFDGYLAELHCRRAGLHLAAGDLAAAQADLALACLLVPAHRTAGPLLVEVYERLGRLDLAVSRLCRMYRADADLGLAMVTLVCNARAGGAPPSAVAPALDAMREREPDGLFGMVAAHQAATYADAPLRPQDAETRYRQAVDAYIGGHEERVPALLLPVLAWAPRVAEGWMLYGVAHLSRLGSADGAGARANVAHAVTALTAAVTIDPGDARCWTELAKAHLAGERPDRAANAARRAARLAADDATAHAVLAVALLSLGDVEEMTAALRNAMALDPGHPLVQDLIAAITREEGT
ncbi:Flp pilus assembly protein TadD [Thermocatellispora tengchongensis]|uniref:Flp pilus assembly protein TadD n=1 Tax=Thermocatellispora tengchongensis TaxID=1073253 RepID=A0A840PB99_9ACTN|nr:hypothetical protein [Thermocatellispora tengchongensis]MBB5134457.1 Flp pilus assembly protein TadD [Thermocatellispora tengchongensis]